MNTVAKMARTDAKDRAKANASADTASDERYLVPGLARGLQLLGCFSRSERELTGAELSRRLALPRASVFRLLHTLEQMGFVERVPDSPAYKLSLGVLRLGFEYLSSMELTEHGRTIIEELRNRKIPLGDFCLAAAAAGTSRSATTKRERESSAARAPATR